MLNNNNKISNVKMEGNIYLYINLFIQYQKRYMILEENCLSIYSSMEPNIRRREHCFHIKFLKINEKKQKDKMFILTYLNRNVYLKTETIDDIKLWITAIEITQLKYNQFFNDYYEKSNEFKELNFGDINDCFKLMIENLNNLFINYDLELLLNKNNILLKKINDYLTEINSFYHKLNENNKNEHLVKNKLKEIKSILNDTHSFLNKCTHGLNIGDIKLYIIEFTENIKNKIEESLNLIEEIKYILRNFVTLKYDYIDEISSKTEADKKNEEKILELKLKNEKLEIMIEEKEIEIDIINNYLNDLV